jgi:HAD superfamily hydrolase (TIGR01549 family)
MHRERALERMTFVMFDLDGTLVDTSALYLQGVPLVVYRHLHQEINVDEYADLWGHDVRQWFARAVAKHAHDGATTRASLTANQLIDDMYAEFEEFYIANHGACPVYAAIAEGLTQLKADGHIIGVVTTRPQRRADLVYEFEWAAHIDFVIGGDRVARRKPFPDALDLAVALHRNADSDAMNLYVGDNAIDIQAARASRHPIVSVAALWGARDADALIAAHPDHRFDSFRDFADWLSSHKENSWAHPSLPN